MQQVKSKNYVLNKIKWALGEEKKIHRTRKMLTFIKENTNSKLHFEKFIL